MFSVHPTYQYTVHHNETSVSTKINPKACTINTARTKSTLNAALPYIKNYVIQHHPYPITSILFPLYANVRFPKISHLQ